MKTKNKRISALLLAFVMIASLFSGQVLPVLAAPEPVAFWSLYSGQKTIYYARNEDTFATIDDEGFLYADSSTDFAAGKAVIAERFGTTFFAYENRNVYYDLTGPNETRGNMIGGGEEYDPTRTPVPVIYASVANKYLAGPYTAAGGESFYYMDGPTGAEPTIQGIRGNLYLEGPESGAKTDISVFHNAETGEIIPLSEYIAPGGTVPAVDKPKYPGGGTTNPGAPDFGPDDDGNYHKKTENPNIYEVVDGNGDPVVPPKYILDVDKDGNPTTGGSLPVVKGDPDGKWYTEQPEGIYHEVDGSGNYNANTGKTVGEDGKIGSSDDKAVTKYGDNWYEGKGKNVFEAVTGPNKGKLVGGGSDGNPDTLPVMPIVEKEGKYLIGPMTDGDGIPYYYGDPGTGNLDSESNGLKGNDVILYVGNDGNLTQTKPVVNIPATGISLNMNNLTLDIGDAQTLVVTVLPGNATDKTVTWTAANSSIATVSTSGRVVGVAAGTTTITARTVNGLTATCSVTVNPEVFPPTGISLNVASMSLDIGDAQTLAATVRPSDATDKTVTWSTSNSSIATVSTSGRVVGVAAGTATITARTVNGFTATCTVTVNPATVFVTSVSVTPASATLEINGTRSLTATVLPSDATNKNVSWTSSNTNVATVNASGVVTAKAAGTATITATTTDGSRTATCSITVNAATVAVGSVSVSPTSATLEINGTRSLTATITPSNATNQSMSWTSSNTNVATVNASGVVTAKAAGTATITATTADGNRTATCSITVNPATVPVISVSLNKSSTTITAGNSEKLTAAINPSNATNQSVSWSSSNTNVATVNANGNISAKAAGSATITVTTADGSRTATCSVTVNAANVAVTGVTLNTNSATLEINETRTLTATVAPSNATNKNVTWSSSNTNVATISSSGVVTAKAAGTTTITVTTTDGNRTATCTVTVNPPASSALYLDKYSVFLLPGETINLLAYDDTGTAVHATWSSSDTSVATVNINGVVTSRGGYGTTIITARHGNNTATCTVHFSVVTHLNLSDFTALKVGVMKPVNFQWAPEYAGTRASNYVFTSSDPSIVAVTKSGVAKGISPGTATLTMRATTAEENPNGVLVGMGLLLEFEVTIVP
jgi:Bacterial surface proteins containing Ig-like domains